jgi:hypothetical protein
MLGSRTLGMYTWKRVEEVTAGNKGIILRRIAEKRLD